MHESHGAYYLVKRNKWTKLGRTLPAALRAYADLISTGQGRIDELIDETIAESVKTCAENTLKTYRRAATAIKKAFAEFSPEQVRPTDIAQFLDAHKDTPNLANQYRTVLKLAFTRAARLGLAESNPVTPIPPFKTRTRDRYITQAEIKRIKEHASPALSVIIDLCYLTGQRIGDVLKIKRKDMDDEGIFVKQQKTGAKLKIKWSAELREVIARANALTGNIKGFHLLASGKGQPFVHDTIHHHWTAACEKANVSDARIHDLRAAAGTDANAAGQDSKALLGHKSESSHQRYMRSKTIPLVEPVKRAS
jgi:integrase